MKPLLYPLSPGLNSIVYTYLILATPFAQSSDPPAAESKIEGEGFKMCTVYSRMRSFNNKPAIFFNTRFEIYHLHNISGADPIVYVVP